VESRQTFIRGHNEGFTTGHRCGIEEGRRQVQQAADTALRVDTEAATFRTHDHAGRQIVEVGGRYAYVWVGDDPLQVGDLVELPGTYISPSGWTSNVTGLGSAYRGALTFIRARLAK